MDETGGTNLGRDLKITGGYSAGFITMYALA